MYEAASRLDQISDEMNCNVHVGILIMDLHTKITSLTSVLKIYSLC